MNYQPVRVLFPFHSYFLLVTLNSIILLGLNQGLKFRSTYRNSNRSVSVSSQTKIKLLWENLARS